MAWVCVGNCRVTPGFYVECFSHSRCFCGSEIPAFQPVPKGLDTSN